MSRSNSPSLLQRHKLLLTALLVLGVICIFLGNTFINLIHNKLEYKRLQKRSEQLNKEYEDLQAKLDLLQKKDPAFVEHLARVQYHMSAPGEIEYRFDPKAK